MEIEDVPDVSARLYLEVVEAAASAPGWLREGAALFTEASIVLLGGLLVLAWWLARGGPVRGMVLAWLAPASVVFGYLASELTKTLFDVDRPCRTLAVQSIVECPPAGDWSFPSNHSAIAGAVAVGVLIARPTLGLVAMPLGALAALSRVFVGVHYPHDVLTGFVLGGLVAVAVAVLLNRPATAVVSRLRERDLVLVR
ncbi:phosphatase PAP2 family protein [Amycolatopsis suaedae]|uniref:Phosphatase PAP2 family protein n=1 Tax=Amycolatopsis suaedae TaxID=2510978 RepID=A0A4Q7J207_9PSEU|nr:phosphatase PAP2 family protein [Amycolatopsis suaedae]RZQ60778.1 phosphatase PAP2 family protein [Amycolatopsis suaedae]